MEAFGLMVIGMMGVAILSAIFVGLVTASFFGTVVGLVVFIATAFIMVSMGLRRLAADLRDHSAVS